MAEGLKYIQKKIGKTGKASYYFRKRGEKKIRLEGEFGSAEFLENYARALEGKLVTRKRRPTVRGKRRLFIENSVGHLLREYQESARWKKYGERIHEKRRPMYARLDEQMGRVEFALVKPSDIRRYLEQFADRYGTANENLKALRQLFEYAVDMFDLEFNPAKQVKYLASDNPDGFHCWTAAECAKFESYWPIGSTPRLAFAIGIYTAQRRGDIVRIGDQFREPGEPYDFLDFVQSKNKERNPVTVSVPILPALEEIIERSETGEATWLITKLGQPFTSDGIGTRFKKWTRAAGLPEHCALHGLRKAACGRMAEQGLTNHEIMAFTGHKTLKEVDRYTRAYNRRLAAISGAEKLARAG